MAVDAAPPISWGESENVRWKVPVPGVGSSTAIVLNDRVYVSAAVKTDRQEEGAAAETQPKAAGPQTESRRGGRGRGRPESPTHYYDFMVLAFDRATGKEIWRTSLTQQVPHEAGHSTNTFASSSPVTDGEHLFVSFGSRGVFCLDLDGKVQWQRDLGQMQTRNAFGEASSPALHNGILVVPWDHEGDSFLVALDGKTGEEKWRTARDEPTTWATPLITDFDGGSQVITNGTNRVRSYDLANGDLIWECGGQVTNPIPTPVRFEDNVICMTGYRGYAIYSIPLSSKGDLTDTDRVSWVEEDAAPYVPSPVLYKGQLYFNKSNTGVLVSRQAKTGELVIEPTRLPEISSIYASPVAANDHIYVTGRDGTTVVLKHGDTMQVVATNKLDDSVDASPAIVGDEIFIRSKSHLYCIAKP
ncbi:outer membrane biogenesis protein BamB [Roseimaritima multifibrata]|uniref:Outer membrane biogenesis protein BamB n=1 Tax=Roseimaritima multifibrata TaxID=1930274 RepID=A0A517MJC6_9BACT|nr:outer membrane biogenesis protein BamB [Roseimaritima multifibrata]